MLFELIKLSEENSKSCIHLELGINNGIRRFKGKWGARPTHRNQICERVLKRPLILEVIRMQNSSNDPYRKALNTALRVLTRRDHSKHELSQKLKARGYAEEVIDEVILECERFDYINDKRTTQVFIRQLQRKGYGRKRIRFELNLKGLRGKYIQGILSKSISDTDECQSAEKILQKHARRFDREKDRLKRKDKIFRFLYGRGFSKAVISEVMGKIG